MSEIRFYHLQRTAEDMAIAQIAAKAIQSGKRVLIKAADKDAAEKLNSTLWTFRADSFVPHGTEKDGNAALQPVYIGVGNENPNEAKILIVSAACANDAPEGFDMCCEMLDGRDVDNVAAARERWKAYKAQGFSISYWQETEQGWEKKA